ncbi:uncharacterized protein LOC129779147 [Toxorhynchites rutilus septentrionalis]|uniref:uncharacterized protein LOC129779147 n=1 Tax=Toxorhynchites rutilus septentrionalis TaxID=329112 RepID=UPI00247A6EBC|nr:uncharacterized protein LOC129779147 [Toxorhynchites rutilus septentrionalis]
MSNSIHVTHGVVTYSGYKQCSITANGIHAEGMNGVIPGWHYGLIKYHCDDNTGILASKMTCQDCGVYCLQNETIEGLIWLKVFQPALNRFRRHTANVRSQRKATKVDKRSILVRNEVNKMLAQNQQATIEEVVEPLYPDLSSAIQEMKRSEEAEPSVHHYNHHSTFSGPHAMLLYISLLTIGFSTTYACDNTLFISSTGEVCEQTHCRTMGMYEMVLLTGSVLCFRDVNGNYLKLEMTEAYNLYTSSLMYYTADYEITTAHKWQCKGTGTCWNGDCNANSKLGSLIRKDQSDEISGYGCDTDTLGCDTTCWYMTACTYYRWTLKKLGPIIPVYRIKSSGWEVNVKVMYLNTTKMYTFTVNRPQINIEQLSINKMPMIIAGITRPDTIMENSIIRIGDQFFNINAADQNMPETGIIGDFQISTHNESATYKTYDVNCQVNSCTPTCRWPEPAIRRALRKQDTLKAIKSVHRGDNRNIVSRQKVKMQANILVGNVDIHNLKVSPAHCNIEIVTTFACTGCRLDSYVVLQANNIKDEGLLKFVSDCEFDVDYISCTEGPYGLYLTKDKDACNIHIPSINKTLHVSFDFKYMGRLDPSVPLYSNSIDIADAFNILSGSGAINTIISSWLGFSIITFIVTAVCKMIRTYNMPVGASIVSTRATNEIESRV